MKYEAATGSETQFLCIDTMAEDASKKKQELLLSIALYETRCLIADCKIKLLLTLMECSLKL